MPLIVGGSALPTDKHIHSVSGEIYRVIAKNGDVIWEIKTGPDKDEYVFFKGTSPDWHMHDSGGKTYIMVADDTTIYGVNHLGTDEVFEHNAVQIVRGHEYTTGVFEIGLKLRRGHWGDLQMMIPNLKDNVAEIDFNGSNKGEGNSIRGYRILGNRTQKVGATYIHSTSRGITDLGSLRVYKCQHDLSFKEWIVD